MARLQLLRLLVWPAYREFTPGTQVEQGLWHGSDSREQARLLSATVYRASTGKHQRIPRQDVA